MVRCGRETRVSRRRKRLGCGWSTSVRGYDASVVGHSHDQLEIVGLLSGAPGTAASPPNHLRSVGAPTFTAPEYDQDRVLPSRVVTVHVALHFFCAGPELVTWTSNPLAPLPVMLQVNRTCCASATIGPTRAAMPTTRNTRRKARGRG